MPDINYIRLSELSAAIDETIRQAFHDRDFWVVADVTDHAYKDKTQYHYFTLVEKGENNNELLAKLPGKAWGQGARKIREFERATGQKFTNNIQVLVKVKVTYHPLYSLALEVVDIDTSFTLGVLEQQRRKTLADLLEKNPDAIERVGEEYVTRNKKLSLPRVIQHIAVISSKTSAGNEDFIHTLNNNSYGYKFRIEEYHTIVQNEVYAKDFLQTLVDVYNTKIKYDVLVINRGGGAQTDFLIFDNYSIGRAVARFPIPIITGIGHHKDQTIADLMAHTSAKTPTKAAELIIAHNRQFEDNMLQFQKNIVIRAQQLFSARQQALSVINSGIVNSARSYLNHHKDILTRNNQVVVGKSTGLLFRHKSDLIHFNQVTVNRSKSFLLDSRHRLQLLSGSIIAQPQIIVSGKLKDLANTVNNLVLFNKKYWINKRGYLGHHASVINMMSPENVLKKGFALVKYRGQVTSDPDRISVGSDMEVVLSDTSIQTTVKSKSQYDGSDFNV